MPDPSDMLDTIADNMENPASASAGDQSASQHNLRDQLAVQQAVAAQAAVEGTKRGFAIQRFKPGGTI